MNHSKKNWYPSLCIILTMTFLLLCPSQTKAWDREPDPVTGKYDDLYDRPTYFPDWEQPLTWPNCQYYLCEVFVGSEKIANYEIAVYDQDNKLRHCSRSIAVDDDQCVLTIRGVEGEHYHFKVIYGDDFSNPVVADIPNLTIGFKTNDVVGALPGDPFALAIPGRTVLSESSVKMPVSATGADVTVKRTLRGGEWNTLCLPISMSASQVRTAFGTNAVLADFTGCETSFEADGNTVSSLNLCFSTSSDIKANHPYIIKVDKDVTSFEIDNIDITVDADNLYVECDRIGEGTKRNPYRYNSFIGNYTASFLVPEECLFLDGGKLKYSDGNAPLKAYSAYFDFYDLLESANPKTTPVVQDGTVSLLMHGYDIVDITFSGTDSWTTYCATANLALPEGIKAYVVTGYGDDAVVAKELSYIPADEPVLLFRSDITVSKFTTRTIASSLAVTANLLRITDTEKHVDVASCYVLYQDEFVLVSDGDLPAKTVYLPLASGANPVRRRILVDGAVVGVNEVTAPSAPSAAYNLRGQRVNGQRLPSLVYIIDGKKVINNPE